MATGMDAPNDAAFTIVAWDDEGWLAERHIAAYNIASGAKTL
jgi:hypothetical protein